MKTHKSTQLFLYSSGGERSVKCVHPALEMEASREEQRGLVRFLVAEGAATLPVHKCLGMLSDGIILLAGKHFNILRTAQIFPHETHIFGDLKQDNLGRRVGFIRTRKCKCW